LSFLFRLRSRRCALVWRRTAKFNRSAFSTHPFRAASPAPKYFALVINCAALRPCSSARNCSGGRPPRPRPCFCGNCGCVRPKGPWLWPFFRRGRCGGCGSSGAGGPWPRPGLGEDGGGFFGSETKTSRWSLEIGTLGWGSFRFRFRPATLALVPGAAMALLLPKPRVSLGRPVPSRSDWASASTAVACQRSRSCSLRANQAQRAASPRPKRGKPGCWAARA